MTYRKIEAIRELRLWIEHVIAPTIWVSAVILSNPEIRHAASAKLNSIKEKLCWKKSKWRSEMERAVSQ